MKKNQHKAGSRYMVVKINGVIRDILIKISLKGKKPVRTNWLGKLVHSRCCYG